MHYKTHSVYLLIEVAYCNCFYRFCNQVIILFQSIFNVQLFTFVKIIPFLWVICNFSTLNKKIINLCSDSLILFKYTKRTIYGLKVHSYKL